MINPLSKQALSGNDLFKSFDFSSLNPPALSVPSLDNIGQVSNQNYGNPLAANIDMNFGMDTSIGGFDANTGLLGSPTAGLPDTNIKPPTSFLDDMGMGDLTGGDILGAAGGALSAYLNWDIADERNDIARGNLNLKRDTFNDQVGYRQDIQDANAAANKMFT